MSFTHIRWALTATVPSGPALLLLVVMADLVRAPEFKVFAAADTLAKRTHMDRKTVLANLKRLEEARLITRLPERVLRGGVPVFVLNMPAESAGTDTETDARSNRHRAGDVNPLFPAGQPNFTHKSTPFSREVNPKAEHKHDRNLSEPVVIQKNSRPTQGRSTDVAKPDDVTEQTWKDFLELRRAKRAPVTKTVLNGAREEARKAGVSVELFLQIWCTRGSQGLQATWLKPSELELARSVVAGAGQRVRGPSFEDMNYEEGVNANGNCE
ncbi:hypothetical protein GCM10028796_31560 [Ramlibacter monticola]|uniref:Helix-turn-helix domain-containing protein n=1 Tax=Ramlibacter monticola TaxID=1926872 RepID=A0A936Z773_9BURK|nr:hypothetical protein [Ramlibacter monticola]MBL0394271.1 hypothetical protein [Ramlibacter monticola]